MSGGCGTSAAYQRHIRAGETPCAECRRANAEYHAAHRAAHPERKEKEARYQEAYHRALSRLVAMHPAMFAALVDEERAS